MSKRELRLFLSEMLESVEKIERQEMIIDAVVMNLEIIGEAAKYIPEDFRDQHQTIEWS